MEPKRAEVAVAPAIGDDAQQGPQMAPQPQGSKTVARNANTSRWAQVKAAHNLSVPHLSKSEIKLRSIMDELKSFSVEGQEEARQETNESVNTPLNPIVLLRRHLTKILQRTAFSYLIILLVITDLAVVLVDLVLAQLSSPCLTDDEMQLYNTTEQRGTCVLEYSNDLARADTFLFYLSSFLLCTFVFEIIISFFTFGWRYYKNPLYLLDSLVVLASFVMEMYCHYGNVGRAGRAAAAVVILRLWKIIRAIHAVAHSITIRNQLILSKIQEAQSLLKEEKIQIEQILERQEIKLDYFKNVLVKIGRLPPSTQTDDYVNKTLSIRKQTRTDRVGQ